MTNSVVHVAVTDGKAIVQTATLQAPHTAVRLKALPQGKYLLVCADDGQGPRNLMVERVGADLQVWVPGEQPLAQLIIEGFYDSGAQLLGLAQGATYSSYLSDPAQGERPAQALADGDLALLTLSEDSVPVFDASAPQGFDLSPWWLAAGAVGLAGIGYAAGNSGGGGGGGSGGDSGGGTPPVSVLAPPVVSRVEDDVGLYTGDVRPNGPTDDPRPTLVGTGTLGNTVSVRIDGVEMGQVVVTAPNTPVTSATTDQGVWSFRPATPLLPGPHSLVVVETDAAGNSSPASEPRLFIVDVQPAGPITLDSVTDDIGAVQSELMPGEVTDDRQPTLAGSGESLSTVIIYVDGAEVDRLDVDVSGLWRYTLATPLEPGTHVLSVADIDEAGNISAQVGAFTLNIGTLAMPSTPVIDNVIDDVPSTAPHRVTEGGFSNDSTLEVRGLGDSGTTVQLYVNGAAIPAATSVVSGGNWQVNLSGLSEGLNTLVATASNAAGNTSAPSVPFTFTLDTTAPDPLLNVKLVDDFDQVKDPVVNGDVIDDATPTFTGTAPPDAVTVVGSAVNTSSGVTFDLGSLPIVNPGDTWRFTPTLADGTYQFSAVAVDAAGNRGAASTIGFTLDTTPPVITLDRVIQDSTGTPVELTDGSLTHDSTLVLEGTATPNSTVTVTINGGLSTTLTSLADGTWRYELPALSDGDYQFSATVTTPAAGQSAAVLSARITLDATPPGLPVLESFIDNVGELQYELGAPAASNVRTDDTRPTLAGRAEANSTLVIYDTLAGLPTEIQRTAVDASGNWSVELATALALGDHALTFESLDAALNSSGQTPLPLTLSVVAGGPASVPTLDRVADDSGSTIASDGFTQDATPTLWGTTEAGSLVTLRSSLGGVLGSAVVTGTTWVFTPFTRLAEGVHEFTAQATNAAGNLSTETVPYSVTIDLAAPTGTTAELSDDVGPINLPIVSGTVTDDNLPVFSGTAERGATVTVTLDGVPTILTRSDDSWSFTPSSALAEGRHSLSVSVRDAAGNTDTSVAPIDFEVSGVLPFATLDRVFDDVAGVELINGASTRDNLLHLCGQATDGSTVRVYMDGSSPITAVNVFGNWTLLLGLGDGPHEIRVTALTEAAGESPVNANLFEVIVDRTPPPTPQILSITDAELPYQGSVPALGVTNDTTPEIRIDPLATERGDQLVLYDNGTEIQRIAVPSGSDWLFTPTVAEGTHRFTVSTADAVGNLSAASTAWQIEVDTTAPVAVPSIDTVGKVADATDPSLQSARDGAAGRLIQGTIDVPLATGESVQVSVDGGVNWQNALVSGAGWSFVDLSAHAFDRRVEAQVVDRAQNATRAASVTVQMDSLAPQPPSGIAWDGTELTVTFAAGTLQAGDRLHLVLDDLIIERELTPAEIASGQALEPLRSDVVGNPSTLSAALVDRLGNGSAYRQLLSEPAAVNTEDFESETERGLLQGASVPFRDFDLSVIQAPTTGGFQTGFHGPRSSGVSDPPQSMALELGGWGVTEVQLQLLASNPATGIRFKVGDLTGSEEIQASFFEAGSLTPIFTDTKTAADVTGGATPQIAFELPYGLAFTSVQLLTPDGGQWKYVWIDDIEFTRLEYATNTPLVEPASDQVVTQAYHYLGGAGANTFAIDSVALLADPGTQIAGQGGIDTLKLSGAGQRLDLTALGDTIRSVEVIDLTGAGDNTLSLTLNDVLEQGGADLFRADGRVQLRVDGNAGDTLELQGLQGMADPGVWLRQGSEIVGGATYSVFQHSALAAEIFVQNAIATTIS